MNNNSILIVDDNQDLADGLASYLEDEGYQTVVTYSGEDALALAEKNNFNVALVDMKLPGINGLETFHKLQESQPDCQVIIITGYRVEQLINEVLGDGVVCVLRKPFDMKVLMEKLKYIIPKGIILIADDDPDLSTVMEAYFIDHNYRVLVANDRQTALDHCLSSSTIDVLVLDLKLPVIHSLDVYLELQRCGQAVPTFIVIDYPAEENKITDILHSQSATGCFLKPFNPEDLLQQIEINCSGKN